MVAELPASVSGFTVLPVTYSSTTTHILYARKHVGPKKALKSKLLPDDRTLFLVNVPPDATERELVVFFKHAGTVERVVFDQGAGVREQNVESDSEDGDELMGEDEEGREEQPRKKRKVAKGDEEKPPQVAPLPSHLLRTIRRTGRSAHVVFLDASSLERALAPTSKPQKWPVSEEELCGLAHYTALYDSLRPPLDAVRAHADSFMELFEYNLEKKKQKSQYHKGEAIVDEDGFTLVTRGGAYGKTLGGGVSVANKRFQQGGQGKRRRKAKEPKEKEGFYAFQRAEKQRKRIIDLQKKWEEDKAKVEKLKETRRFKPY